MKQDLHAFNKYTLNKFKPVRNSINNLGFLSNFNNRLLIIDSVDWLTSLGIYYFKYNYHLILFRIITFWWISSKNDSTQPLSNSNPWSQINPTNWCLSSIIAFFIKSWTILFSSIPFSYYVNKLITNQDSENPQFKI